MRFYVKSKNKYLKQKILLDCIMQGHEYYESKKADVVFCDIDTVAPTPTDVTMSKSGIADIALPYNFEALAEYLGGKTKGGAVLYADPESLEVYLRGEKIHLSLFEKKLFYVLYKAHGEFVSREELLLKVWDNDADIGIVNVYVYYLRKRLEKSGERIIIAARKEGYKIDKKYLGGRESC